MNLVRRYRGSKGVRELRLEEPPLTSLAATCHMEESARHHIVDQQGLPHRHEEPPLASLAVTCHLEESASHHIIKSYAGHGYMHSNGRGMQ